MTDADARLLRRGDHIRLRMQPSWNGHYPQRYRFTVDKIVDLGSEVYIKTIEDDWLLAWEVERYEPQVNH